MPKINLRKKRYLPATKCKLHKANILKISHGEANNITIINKLRVLIHKNKYPQVL